MCRCAHAESLRYCVTTASCTRAVPAIVSAFHVRTETSRATKLFAGKHSEVPGGARGHVGDVVAHAAHVLETIGDV